MTLNWVKVFIATLLSVLFLFVFLSPRLRLDKAQTSNEKPGGSVGRFPKEATLARSYVFDNSLP